MSTNVAIAAILAQRTRLCAYRRYTQQFITADPSFDFGQRVTITADGFRPLWLVSIIHQPVVWTNDTDTPQTIVFDHLPVRSGVIPPGGTYTYTPDTVASITYHSGRRPTLEGKVQASWSSSDEAAANSGG